MNDKAPLAQRVLWQRACGQEQASLLVKAFTTRHTFAPTAAFRLSFGLSRQMVPICPGSLAYVFDYWVD